MLFELILLLILGTVFLILGFIIREKEKIDLINSLHSDKVSEENKGAFTALMGKGMIIIGTGMFLTGIIDYFTHTTSGWIAFGICFAVGLFLFIFATKKYNK